MEDIIAITTALLLTHWKRKTSTTIGDCWNETIMRLKHH